MFAEALYHLTIRPLEILFETIFFILFGLTGKPLFTIVGLSKELCDVFDEVGFTTLFDIR